ncbi:MULTISPECIES: hypothetical protein [unclassified Polaromonas]|jgi:hypothetical protein|uniref:hypothetical protein n=1 Tax=unclassified Polaromonas TaxID=2638319 RepID=UPI0025E46334|nr:MULTISPECIES: hypothetical protein [unclassified Polaromonas]HQR98152.1 hypothetical protein [Polaromonas sp.]HQS38860.1 hypothetical protein [Polaromonas sp.]HQS88113.1 hypothetical protein [Polaromonas sp.]
MTIRTFTALASAARTTSGTVDLDAVPSEYQELSVYLDVTATSGTSPSMTVTYQSSPDGVTFFDNTAGAAITAVGKQLIKVPSTIGGYGRLSYAISGTTPSFTFSAVAEYKRS